MHHARRQRISHLVSRPLRELTGEPPLALELVDMNIGTGGMADDH